MSPLFSFFEIWLCPKVLLATAIFPPPLKAMSVTILITFFKASVFLSHVKNSFKDCHLIQWLRTHSSGQFSHSLCPTLCDPMDCSMPGLAVHHQLPEFTQTHVHWVGDAIQSSHPLWSPSPPTFNLSQHQGLFKWVSSSHQVAKELEFQLQHQSFQWVFRTDLLAVQGTLKSLLQYHSWVQSILGM